MIGRLIFIGLLVLYPKAMAEWLVAIVLAFIAAYLTVADVHWIAPIGAFLLWYMADYILIQIIFGVLFNRRKTCAPQS